MSNDQEDVLEQNVGDLITTGGEAPKIDAAARTRIRDGLVEKFAVAAAPAKIKARTPLYAAGFGLAAAAGVAAIAVHLIDHADVPVARLGDGEQKLADGTTYVAAPGTKVSVLGPRSVRIEGAALLDVSPGKGTFTVETAHGQIQVLGTRFVVDGAADQTTAAVIRGEVKLASPDGDVVLHAGEQAIAAPGHAPVRGPAPRLSHLVAWAQQARTSEAHALPVHHGTLFARDPGVRSHPPWGDEYPLPIKQLTLDITVEDQVARVALDQTFHNNAPQDLEGVYRFAIPPTAALQRLAMYVDGKLTESAVVERMRARRIYEELVYRRVDPALLEWAGTGRLSLKVYPLKANEDKRLMLAYTESLPKLYDDYTVTVPLPEVDERVGAFDVNVRIKNCANCELVSTSHQIATERSGEDAIVKLHRTNEKLGDSFVLHVRDPRHATAVATADDGGDHFVMVRAPIELAKTAKPYKPRAWVILDDVSASRGTPELHAQRDLVEALVKELDENDQVSVIAFDVQARTKLAPTRVMDVDHRALRERLDHEGGVGATDFEAALAAATQQLAGVDADSAMIVYLGDGMVTTGARTLDALRAEIVGKAHFIGVGVGDGPDTQMLGGLAAATGGYATTMDLADDLGWRAFDLVAALHTSRVTGLTAALVGASGPIEATTYLAAPQLADGEELELVAKLGPTAPTAPTVPTAVELAGTLDGAPWKQTIAVGAAPANVGPHAGYLPRLWAERHIAARLLAKHDAVTGGADAREARDEQIRREVVALGKKYFLLSRHTSLLVLENDAMYAQYGVTKGAGDTWAPYVLPATIPVVRTPTPAIAIAADADLVRSPFELFFGYDQRWLGARADLQNGTGAQMGPTTGAVPHEPEPDTSKAGKNEAKTISTDDLGEVAGKLLGTERGAMAGGFGFGVIGHGAGYGGGGRASVGDGFFSRRQAVYAQGLTPQLSYAANPAFDDLTTFVPALVDDAADKIRRQLGTPGAHTISESAKTLLTSGRAKLAAGVYRWGEREITVDAAHRFSWKRTTETGLVEHAAFDGAVWMRRYPELGLDVTRSIAADEVAFGLGYLPLWIAAPAHYAQYFDVSAKGRDVFLARGTATAFVMSFDDQARLTSIRDGNNHRLVEVTWGASGPLTAKVAGETIAVGFTAQPISDAVGLVMAGTQPGVVAELPGHLVAYWQQHVAAETVATPAWRRASRQLLVAAAAQKDRPTGVATFEALRAHGGVELGDLVLASGGLVGTSESALAQAMAAFPQQPVAQYVLASRGYHNQPARLQPRIVATVAQTGGLITALGDLRRCLAQLAARDGKGALATFLTLPAAATDLRLSAAAAANQQWDLPVEQLLAMWDAVAVGRMKNIARVQAATLLYQREKYDAAADRLVALVDDLDLSALPPQLAQTQSYFSQARRGDAGWELLYATWRAKVLAGQSYPHVIAVLPVALQHPQDVMALLAHGGELAGDDATKQLALVQFALSGSQTAWARARLRELVAKSPTHEVYQAAAQLAIRTGNPTEALADLEAAQDHAAGPGNLATIRGELAQLITVAQQVVLQTTGPERAKAIAKAMAWGDKWRAIDPGNAEIDRQLGELLLAAGDEAGAWRQLSSTIERDPWSGTGYMMVAESFERRGKVLDALPYWQQAIVIDQTNPTPRLRKAQALIALGRNQEGDQLLAQITSQKWHDIWSGVVFQAQALRQQHQR